MYLSRIFILWKLVSCHYLQRKDRQLVLERGSTSPERTLFLQTSYMSWIQIFLPHRFLKFFISISSNKILTGIGLKVL